MLLGAIMVPHPPLIIPEVGRGEEHMIDETKEAYIRAGEFVTSLKPDTVVIASPHSIMYRDYIHISPGRSAEGDLARFRAPQVKVHADYDSEMAEKIAHLALNKGISAGLEGERDPSLDHGTLIPLYFINRANADASPYKVVRIGLSMLPFSDHYRLGQIIQKASDELGRRVVFIGSGDLSHKLQSYGPYGYAKEGPEYDERIMEVMGSGRFDRLFGFTEDFCEKAAECGHRSFVMMAGALDGLALEIHKMSHQDVTGVGYGICTYRATGTDESRHFLDMIDNDQPCDAQEDPYIKLARDTIETYIRTGRTINVPDDLPVDMLNNRAGVFVSLHKHGELRGCIGTISPTTINIASEIIQNAVSSSTKDPRFDRVREDELEDLEISVDVLKEAEDISSISELDVKRYGVIVTKGFRRGLLLPNLEVVDTPEVQVRIALMKAGLSPDEKDYDLKRFEVIRHEYS